ncbi:MAG TPA: hypothetical protein VFS43_39475 [Polyangiaceae bacterium]|nr:hypothetical protein [Polyangiaceae bacterium]
MNAPSADDLEALIVRFGERISGLAPGARSYTPGASVEVLRTYADAFAPNFVVWLATAWNGAQSPLAREICRTNLLTEVGEDHPRMLREFVGPLVERFAGGPSAELDPILRKITSLTANRLDALLVVAGVESASVRFMPWVAEAASSLDSRSSRYVELHLAADVSHSGEMVDALRAEARSDALMTSENGGSGALLAVESLVRLIFRPFSLSREAHLRAC